MNSQKSKWATQAIKVVFGGFGLLALAAGIQSAIQGDLLLLTSDTAFALFMTYIYLNPTLLLASSGAELDAVFNTAKASQLLWISLSVGVFTTVLSLLRI